MNTTIHFITTRIHSYERIPLDWVNRNYSADKKKELINAIYLGKLPEFDRVQNSFNGLGISVHDTWATEICIKSLQISEPGYRAVINYKVQDHFGLDNEDLHKFKFNQFRFFRIWFVLQRYALFGFKPFMTNIDATVAITGNPNEVKK